MKQIETEDVFFSIEDGILFCSCKKQIKIDLEVAKRIIENRVEFTEGKSYPIVMDFTNLHSVTKEAREYFNAPEGGLKGLLGGAFLSNSLVTTLIVNLYLKLNQPVIPAKFFTGKNDAINWIKNLKLDQK